MSIQAEHDLIAFERHGPIDRRTDEVLEAQNDLLVVTNGWYKNFLAGIEDPEGEAAVAAEREILIDAVDEMLIDRFDSVIGMAAIDLSGALSPEAKRANYHVSGAIGDIILSPSFHAYDPLASAQRSRSIWSRVLNGARDLIGQPSASIPSEGYSRDWYYRQANFAKELIDSAPEFVDRSDDVGDMIGLQLEAVSAEELAKFDEWAAQDYTSAILNGR